MSALAVNLQILFSGLALGAIYALVALGFVLIIRATNVVNFAQGDFAMLGAYAMTTMFTVLHLPYWLSVILALITMTVIGIVFNYGVYYPLRNRSFLPVLISTLGASIFMQNTVLAVYGPQPRPLDKVIDIQGLQFG
ncbi:MAG: branched-chain amino acid ABC transporter permease, partial [Gammaproteobacteria bacterium]